MGFFDFLKPKPQKPVPVKQTQSKRIENVVFDDPEIRKLQRDLKAQDKQLEQAAGCCSTVQNGHSGSLICI